MSSADNDFVTVFDLESDEGLNNLRKFFGLKRMNTILSKFFEFVSEFDDDNYQDSFRIRIVSMYNDVFNNKDEYKKLITCCGSTDREYTIDDIPDVVFEFGCNYGH